MVILRSERRTSEDTVKCPLCDDYAQSDQYMSGCRAAVTGRIEECAQIDTADDINPWGNIRVHFAQAVIVARNNSMMSYQQWRAIWRR